MVFMLYSKDGKGERKGEKEKVTLGRVERAATKEEGNDSVADDDDDNGWRVENDP